MWSINGRIIFKESTNSKPNLFYELVVWHMANGKGKINCALLLMYFRYGYFTGVCLAFIWVGFRIWSFSSFEISHLIGIVYFYFSKIANKLLNNFLRNVYYLSCHFLIEEAYTGCFKKSRLTLNLIFWKFFAGHITLNYYFNKISLVADYSEQLFH